MLNNNSPNSDVHRFRKSDFSIVPNCILLPFYWCIHRWMSASVAGNVSRRSTRADR
jgi:hypothetical protein